MILNELLTFYNMPYAGSFKTKATKPFIVSIVNGWL